MHILVLCIHTLWAYSYNFCKITRVFAICYIVLFVPHDISIKAYNLLYYYKIQQIRENKTSIMVWKVDKRILEEMFIQLLAKKANIIKDHL